MWVDFFQFSMTKRVMYMVRECGTNLLNAHLDFKK